MNPFKKAKNYIFGSGGGGAKATQYDNWNDDQKALAGSFGGGLLDAFNNGGQGTLNNILSGRPSSQIDEATTRNYFQNSMYAPAQHQFQTQTMPQINETMGGNFWSSARQNAQQNAIQDFDRNMNSTLHDLLYQDKQKEYDLNEAAYNRALQGFGLVNQFLGLDPYTTHVTNDPGKQGLLGRATGYLDQLRGFGNALMGT
ncbi:MAG: hypothetical protein FWG92_02405 [Leptospirales bacterium]|nr:hypothetical protein [Leptospirales bacterium]